ncbi:hypothetical protein QQY79_09995 [Flavobacterium tructae]|uniref:hypothetical protein n=1 Tax=Flavobacterium tructae TaxID=1114873 RepID=UPI002551D9F0|nr:hypothetical protein [Flavobacterium tructae]MDL2142849.1 hypothetical protein [Flavobacterium tructae]
MMNIIKSSFCLILVSFMWVSCSKEKSLVEPEKIEASESLKNKIPKNLKIVKTEKVNLNNDLTIFICLTLDEKKGEYSEYWFSSNEEIKQINKFYSESNKKWFVNIDEDPELEMLKIITEEGYIDCAFYDVDKNSFNSNVIFNFDPLILKDDKKYWGFSGDIDDIILKDKKLLTTIENDIPDYEERKMSVNQKKLPILYFKSDKKDLDIIEEKIGSCKFMSISEIKQKIN